MPSAYTYIFSIISFLFIALIIFFAEKNKELSSKISSSSLIYAIGFSVYFLAWTYFEIISRQMREGMLYVGVFIGAVFTAPVWHYFFCKMVLARNKGHVVSKHVDTIFGHDYQANLGYGKSRINLKEKCNLLLRVLADYVSPEQAETIVDKCLESRDLRNDEVVSLLEAAEILNEAERYLAGLIGTAAAHLVIKKNPFFSQTEMKDLSNAYAGLLADLNISPEEMMEKTDYYQEREKLYKKHSEDLQKNINELRKFRRAIEQSASIVIITDLNGRIEYVNPKFTEITGYCFEDVYGKNPKILKSDDQNASFYHDLWETISSGNEWKGEIHNKKKNGELYWEYASISPIKNMEGEVLNYVAVKEDITEKKQWEQQLLKTKEELEIQAWGLQKTNDLIKILYKELEENNKELRKLDQMKSDFISTVSHELRTPLTIIREGVDQVVTGVLGDTTEEQREFLHMALTNIDRLSRIINNLLDMSKIESSEVSPEFTKFDISLVIREVRAAFLSSAYEKKLTLSEKLPKGAINITADRDKIIQVFTNLVGNALKFTKTGFIEIGLCEYDKHVECWVLDSGIGIEKEHISKLFDKFQQFGRVNGPGEKGTGLGLSIAKAIVEMHRGFIRVESTVGKGTRFIFTLPKKVDL